MLWAAIAIPGCTAILFYHEMLWLKILAGCRGRQ